VAIVALYEPLSLYPTKDLLIMRLWKGLIHSCMHRPIEKSATFDPLALKDLFHEWGTRPTKRQLHVKLLVLLCLVGAF
jgi:hypothetical protein